MTENIFKQKFLFSKHKSTSKCNEAIWYVKFYEGQKYFKIKVCFIKEIDDIPVREIKQFI